MTFPPQSCTDLSPMPTSFFPGKSSLLCVSSFHLPTIHHSHFSAHIHAALVRMCPPSHPGTLILQRVIMMLCPLISLSNPQSNVSHTQTHTRMHSHRQRITNNKLYKRSFLLSLSVCFFTLCLTLALLGTPAVILVFLTDYSSCSPYRFPPWPRQPINLLTDKTLPGPSHGGHRCELMLADHTRLNAAGPLCSQCLPVALPFIQTTETV